MDASREGCKIKNTEDYEDLKYIMKCYHLALQNPDMIANKAVASIIIKNGVVLGVGCRKVVTLSKNPYRDTAFHAEHIALLQAREQAKGATLYSTIEPCAKREMSEVCCLPPKPCCELIVESGIKRVVFAVSDDEHGAGGAKYLSDNGIDVCICSGIDEEAFQNLLHIRE